MGLGPETIVTLIGVGIAILAVAGYLTIVALTLNHVAFTVGTILIGVRSIANQTEPIGEVVGSILTDVDAINNALLGLLGEGEISAGDTPYRRKAISRATANTGF